MFVVLAFWLLAASTAPSAGARSTAMHAILSFALNGAQQQFRDVRKAPKIARVVFDYCQVPPRNKFEPVFGGRPMFECEDSWWEVFKGRADYVKAVRAALPPGLTRTVSCPPTESYDGLTLFACLRTTNGTEVQLLENGDAQALGPKYASFSIFVLAPPLSQGARARVQREAAKALRPLLEGMTEIASHDFGEADGTRFAARHAASLKGCDVRRPPAGRPVLDCELRVLGSIAKTDFTAAVRDSLPKGFRRSRCVETSSLYADLSPLCERNDKAVEVRFGEGLHIEADNTAYPASPTATMRQFLIIALAAAARNFQAYDPKTELPYFGQCSVEQQSKTEPKYLACDPDSSVAEFDLLALVRRALPPGYSDTQCTLPEPPSLNPENQASGCFGSGNKPEIDVELHQGDWHVQVGLPQSS